MSRLTIYIDDLPNVPVMRTENLEQITVELSRIGVRFERWDKPVDLDPNTAPESILAAYRPYLDELIAALEAVSVDVVLQTPDYPEGDALRLKFLSEHVHNEDETRVFVQGSGNLMMHTEGQVWDAHCTAGDLISVPANMPHWFDAGPEPRFTALRVYTARSGWIPHYTGLLTHERFHAS